MEVAAHFITGGDEDGGVTGAAGKDFVGDIAGGEVADGVDNLADGEALAGANVESVAGDASDVLQGEEMGFGDVEDMDVIANAGAVGSGIVVAKDFEVRGAALDGLQDARDEMGFGAASFSALGGGAGDVEVAESDVVEGGVFAIVGEDVFKGELGFAVGVYGRLGMVLGNGDGVRFAVDGAGGGEDEIADAVAEHGVEKENAASDVGDIEGAGVLHGFLDEGFGSEMHNGVDFVEAEDFVEGGGIAKVDLVEESLRGDGGALAFGEVVDGDDADALLEEEFGADAADVAGATGDENEQKASLLKAGC